MANHREIAWLRRVVAVRIHPLSWHDLRRTRVIVWERHRGSQISCGDVSDLRLGPSTVTLCAWRQNLYAHRGEVLWIQNPGETQALHVNHFVFRLR